MTENDIAAHRLGCLRVAANNYDDVVDEDQVVRRAKKFADFVLLGDVPKE